MGKYEMSDKQIERFIRDQIFQAIDEIAKDIDQGASPLGMAKLLKAKVKRILKGEMIYNPL